MGMSKSMKCSQAVGPSTSPGFWRGKALMWLAAGGWQGQRHHWMAGRVAAAAGTSRLGQLPCAQYGWEVPEREEEGRRVCGVCSALPGVALSSGQVPKAAARASSCRVILIPRQ